MGLPVLALAGVLAGAGTADAHAIDYGALEDLFGEPVTASVTGSPQRASDVPASMVIITADEIRRSGARDIPGVLRHVPGVDVLQWTNDQADVSLRGYNQAYSSRLLVLVDGRQVYADDYGYTPWATLPVELSDIRQIEIVFGPNSALFGFNAAGGVINIVTYDPLYDEVKTGSISGGTQGLVQGAATATFKLGEDAGLRLSLGGHHDDDFSTPQRPVDIGTRQGNQRMAIDLLGRVRITHDIDASLELSHSEVEEPEITPLYAAFSTDYRLNSVKASISGDTDAGIIQAVAYGNWLKVRSIAPDPSVSLYQVDNSVYVVQLRDIFKAGTNHTFRLSGEYRYNEMGTTPLSGGNVHYDVLSGGAMWDWQFEPDISFTNALRADYLTLGRSGSVPPGYGLANADWNARSMTEISFNSGIVWRADAENTFRVTTARGIQLPNLFDLGGLLIGIPPFGYASGIPTLKPTIVMNYEADWDRKLPAWDARLRVRLFHQTSRDITANAGGANFPLGLLGTPTNIGRSKATGLELSLDGNFSGDWRWGLSYTPEAVSDNFRPGLDFATILVDYEHTRPIHIVDANLGWAHGRWQADGFLRYQSEFDSIQGASALIPTGTLVRIADYVSVDARVAYRVTDHLTLAVSGQNLLQSPQRQTSAPEVERRVLVTASVNL